MLAGVFIAGAVGTLRNPTTAAAKAAPLVDQAHALAPADVSRRLPRDPRTVVMAHAGLQAGAGILFATGRAPRLAAAALAATIVPATYVSHPFWSESDPELRAQHQAHFVKNVGLLGGVLLATADTEGKPSLAWRGRRTWDHATTAAAASLGAMRASKGLSESTALSRVGEGFSTFAEKMRDASAVAADKGAELYGAAAERVPDLLDTARERGSSIAHLAADRGSDAWHVARERGAELAEVAAERGSAIAEVAAERGSSLYGTSAHLAQRAGDQARLGAARISART